MLFGTFFLEQDPIGLPDLPEKIVYWIQAAGGFAALGLLLWLLFRPLFMGRKDRQRIPGWQSTLFLFAVLGCAAAYVVATVIAIVILLPPAPLFAVRAPAVTRGQQVLAWCLVVGGACALLAVGLPLLRNLPTLRPRRVLALARLSFKEALRRRVLYAFAGMLLVFLFASWFVPYKDENQVRNYVKVVATPMTWLLLLVSGILAAFSIPTDIRNQTIHTIITKPVERFEIVLGRFLGFLALMTLVLVVMSALSLIYVFRGVNPAAADESLKARVPLYGNLQFEGTSSPERGESVGREWEYRGYISGPMLGKPVQYAIWTFPELPASLAQRRSVPCEFTFDIFRTTKGQENRGVSIGFFIRTWRCLPGNEDKFREERNQLRRQPHAPTNAEINDQLAEKYGYFEVPGLELTDYHTQTLELPGGLFRNALTADDKLRRESRARSSDVPAPLEVRVRCNSVPQYVGMAKYDLYLRQDDPQSGNEKMLFAFNYFKGAFGLWLRLALVLGLAVALSTYLSGVISLLVTLMIYLGGVCLPFIESVAQATNFGGGPMEALVHIVRREVTGAPLDQSATTQVATASDKAFRWMIRRVINVIPNVDRFDWTSFVAEGFNISGSQLLLDTLLLLGYLLPWAALAFYLIKWREVASSS